MCSERRSHTTPSQAQDTLQHTARCIIKLALSSAIIQRQRPDSSTAQTCHSALIWPAYIHRAIPDSSTALRYNSSRRYWLGNSSKLPISDQTSPADSSIKACACGDDRRNLQKGFHNGRRLRRYPKSHSLTQRVHAQPDCMYCFCTLSLSLSLSMVL